MSKITKTVLILLFSIFIFLLLLPQKVSAQSTCGLFGSLCGSDTDCCSANLCKDGVCQPNSNILPNYARNYSCRNYCLNNGYAGCSSIGTDDQASNGLAEVNSSGSCGTTTSYDCYYVIYNSGLTCDGHTTDWTNCNCYGYTPPPTPTPTPTPIPTPTPTIPPTITATPTPTPTPVTSCSLQNFGDINGNPVRQSEPPPAWRDMAYGGRNYIKPDGSKVFLPFIWKGDGKDTIGAWGCKLTSAAMVVNYFANEQNVIDSSTGKIFQTDPAKLNSWLQQNDGYSSGAFPYPIDDPTHWIFANVDLNSVALFAKKKGVNLSWDGALIPREKTKTQPAENIANFISRTKGIVNESLCSLDPVILRVNTTSGDHFIDATGKTVVSGLDTWNIYDPIWNGILPGISTLKEKYGSTYSKVDLMSGNLPKRHLIVNKYSPIEMYITDPLGRRVGYDVVSDSFFEEVPSASYGTEWLSADDVEGGSFDFGMLDIVQPEEGEYILTVTGIGDGEYGLEIRGSDNEANISTTLISGQAVTGQTEIFKIGYSSEADSQVQVSKEILVDLKPDSIENKINIDGESVIPVAILSTSTFDATEVDPLSVKFGPGFATEVHNRGHIKDVNEDGVQDLLLHFDTTNSQLKSGENQACLSGQTKDGLNIEGCDSVNAF